jgi:predicted nuclease with RNAse H fold
MERSTTSKFIGIDFSGGARPWRVSVTKPTVWIATVDGEQGRLVELIPVQALPGSGSPFDRLVEFLKKDDVEVAAVDAPFSIPSAHARCRHSDLIQRVRTMPNGPDRPFPMGQSILELANPDLLARERKPLRQTEIFWAKRQVPTRSTMWNGRRGGAPFTAACLRLIERTGRPCWPWSDFQPGILVEAFPAAQLSQWSLPHKGYSGLAGRGTRECIVAKLRSRLHFDADMEALMIATPDALDAVIATFAAMAVAKGTVVGFACAPEDGFIAVAS